MVRTAVSQGKFAVGMAGSPRHQERRDVRQTNYHPHGGKENNSPEQFIANVPQRTPGRDLILTRSNQILKTFITARMSAT